MTYESCSPRESVAHELAVTCTFGELNESYGVGVAKSTDPKGKTYWSVTFAKARTLDGTIKVYSPNFILVKWQGARARVGALDFTGTQVLHSEADAKKFIIDHFVDRFIPALQDRAFGPWLL